MEQLPRQQPVARSMEACIGQKLQLIGDQFHREHLQLVRRKDPSWCYKLNPGTLTPILMAVQLWYKHSYSSFPICPIQTTNKSLNHYLACFCTWNTCSAGNIKHTRSQEGSIYAESLYQRSVFILIQLTIFLEDCLIISEHWFSDDTMSQITFITTAIKLEDVLFLCAWLCECVRLRVSCINY